MYEAQRENDGSPVFHFRMNGSAVTVMFSESGMTGVKEKVRDILTESYGERFRDKVEESVRER